MIEKDIIDNTNYSLNMWLKSINNTENSIEDQAIRLSDNKNIKKLKAWKKILSKKVNFLKEKYPRLYKYMDLKYFKKYTANEIERKFKIPISEQKKNSLIIVKYISKKIYT